MKRQASEDAGAKEAKEKVTITPLGAGQEVGRSCYVLKYLNKTVMFDCGIHPAHKGILSLPFLDEFAVSDVDMALITHFHLDHCAAVPFLCLHTEFRGRIFMTHATKNIFYVMMKDMQRMGRKDHKKGDDRDASAFTMQQLDQIMAQIEVINFHQTMDIDGVQVTPYRAGHVLGAAMFMVEIQGMRCLYTGDYSRVQDRHMPAADLPAVPPHILIVESTFGVSNHLARADRERDFQNAVREIVSRGGRCLLPVVALGRAQELLLILEDCWHRHADLHAVPIYQTSGIASQSMTVYQAYIDMMNEDVRQAFKQRNPFNFRYVRHTRGFRADDESGPCVVLATPSMLQTGLSRELFEAWCDDRRNGVIIADFAVQGTLAAELLRNPTEVVASDGRMVPCRCEVKAFSFSAHADFSQTSAFVRDLAPAHVVLCHGNPTEMERLRKALEKQAAAEKAAREIHTPANLEKVELGFVPRRTVRVLGQAAEAPLKRGDRVHGVVVHRQRHGDPIVVLPKDLGKYTKVATGTIRQRQVLRLSAPFGRVRAALELTFDGVDGNERHMGGVQCLDAAVEGAEVLRIAELVRVTHVPSLKDDADDDFGQLLLEWDAGPVPDCTADAVVAVALQAQEAPRAIGVAERVRREAVAEGDDAGIALAERSIVVELLRAQFGAASVDEDSDVIIVTTPGTRVVVDWALDKVVCEPPNASLHARISLCLERMRSALQRFQPGDLTVSEDTLTEVMLR